jgi:hypothetical protein
MAQDDEVKYDADEHTPGVPLDHLLRWRSFDRLGGGPAIE